MSTIVMLSLSYFFTKSWADDLEDMGQGQKVLYMTQFLLVVNICTKYEKDPANGRKVTAWFPDLLKFHLHFQ